MSLILDDLKRRCEAAGLYTEQWGDWRDEMANHSDEAVPASLMIEFPLGDSAISIEVEDGHAAEWLSREPFESYRGLDGFAASWSEERRTVECSLGYSMTYPPISGPAQLKVVLERLGHEDGAEQRFEAYQRVQFDSDIGLSISVGPCSNMHSFLCGGGAGGDPGDGERVLSLQIEDIEVTTDDAAREILQRVANSLLFQLDMSLGLTLMLQRVDTLASFDGSLSRLSRLYRRIKQPVAVPSLPPLRLEYDNEPMSLYWYAQTASAMPLLQFLAYYQVLEYYFAAYSPSKQIEALRQKLKEIAGDVRDADVNAVLSTIGVSKRRLFPEERKQLRSTIQRCVDPAEFNSFLAGDDERVRFYGSEESVVLSTHKIPVGTGREDYRNKVAARIYEIRNRIVHTKSQHDELEPLLPFDREVIFLEHDVALVRFLAQKVLVSSARPLTVSSSRP